MTILDEIAESRKKDLPLIREVLNSSDFKNKNSNLSLQHKPLSQILKKQGGVGIISELKLKSPSKGQIIENSGNILTTDSDGNSIEIMTPTLEHIDGIINKMVNTNICGISVLTEPRYFSGSYGNLKRVSEIVSNNIPILMKEFVIDESQIKLGKKCGASNGLVISSICDPYETAKLMMKHGLEPLIEIHNSIDLKKIKSLKNLDKSFIIGVNNRDLKNMRVNFNSTFELVPKIREIFGEDQIIITESGISNRGHIIQLARTGINAALVGTSIIRGNITQKINELMGSQKPFVKICGIKDPSVFEKQNFEKQNSENIKDNPVTAYGVVMDVPDSPRSVDIEKAREIFNCSPPYFQRVIVTKDKNLDFLIILDKKLNPDLIQCYFEDIFTKPKEIPASLIPKILFPIRLQNQTIQETTKMINSLPKNIFGVVLDSSEGHGKLIDSKKAKKIVESCSDYRVIIAGGISSLNVKKIYSEVQPFGIDASSSLENAPGSKDPHKIHEFLMEIRKIQSDFI